MTSAWSMSVLVLTPLIAAALAFVLPKRGAGLALATVAAIGFATVQLTLHVLADGVETHRVGGWGPPLGIDLRADGLAVIMLIVTATVGAAVSLYARGYFEAHEPERLPTPLLAPAGGEDAGCVRPISGGEAAGPDEGSGPMRSVTSDQDEEVVDRGRYFWPLFLLLWAALNALFLASDIFNLYVTLELLSLAAVTLVALAGKPDALTAAMRYLFVSLAGSLFYLLGVGLTYGQCATVDLPSLATKAQPGATLWVALALMSGGLVAKAALFPLHFWLPPAHANAPAPVSALLSALVVKGSFYILIRLWFEAFHPLMTSAVAQLFGALGAAAILWGSLNALFQPRLKLLIAYSTVAQLGYLFLVFPLAASHDVGFAAWSGGLIFLSAHACAKTAMFLTAGNVLQAAGHDRIKDLDGISHVLPLSAFTFGLSGMSLVGLPPSGGFGGKWLLLSSSVAQDQWWWAAVILVGSLLAAAYVIRVLTHAFTKTEEPTTPNPIPPVMEWTALGLALLAAGLGLSASWLAELLRIGSPVVGATFSGGFAP